MKVRRLACGATLAVLLLAAPNVAAARSITIAWDPNPEPNVSGYVVYVGSESGVYAERYDVGKVTSFVYPAAADNQPYYFSVAAYAADLLPGPRSEEVSSTSVAPSIAPAATSANSLSFDPVRFCTDASSQECYTVRALIRTVRPITGLAVSPDDRVFFIDNGQQIRVIADGRLSAVPALTVTDSRRFSGITFDSDFAATQLVFVGEVESARDGTEELSIVRYRELQGVLGERAVIVSALALPPSGTGILTTDSAGRIYVAIPSAGDRARLTRNAYSGRILRFNVDGTVAADNGNASPILARGFDQPSAFAWNGATQLLVTGQDVTAPWLTRLDLAASATQWPRTLGAVSVATSTGAARSAAPDATGEIPSLGSPVFLIDRANRLNRVLIPIDGAAEAGVIPLPGVEHAVAVAAGPRSKTYVVASLVMNGGLSILELTPSLP